MTRSEHRSYGVSVLRSRPRSVRAVGAVGQDGLAVRTGQLRSTRPRLTRSRSRSRTDRVAPSVAAWGSRRLAAPRVIDHPRLVGWSSLHRSRRQSLTPLVAAAGTAWPVPDL